jgi:hypothetical protein
MSKSASKIPRAGTSQVIVEVPLAFGSTWLAQQGEAAQPPARGAERRTNLERRTLNGRIPYNGVYPMRGRWRAEDYTRLRNAAWAVRNSRVGAGFNPLALKLVLMEADLLVVGGEPLWDVLEAFAELLTHP